MSIRSLMNGNLEANSHLQEYAPAIHRPVRVVGVSTQ